MTVVRTTQPYLMTERIRSRTLIRIHKLIPNNEVGILKRGWGRDQFHEAMIRRAVAELLYEGLKR